MAQVFERPLTIIRSVVEANPIPGGEPVEIGVAQRARIDVNGNSVTEQFPEPWPSREEVRKMP